MASKASNQKIYAKIENLRIGNFLKMTKIHIYLRMGQTQHNWVNINDFIWNTIVLTKDNICRRNHFQSKEIISLQLKDFPSVRRDNFLWKVSQILNGFANKSLYLYFCSCNVLDYLYWIIKNFVSNSVVIVIFSVD